MNSECIWTIRASPGNLVDLSFLTFNLGPDDDNNFCNTDYVEIREGTESGTVVGRFCGSTVPSTLVSTSNVFWVMFRSSDAGRHPGFQAEYKLRNDRLVGYETSSTDIPLRCRTRRRHI